METFDFLGKEEPFRTVIHPLTIVSIGLRAPSTQTFTSQRYSLGTIRQAPFPLFAEKSHGSLPQIGNLGIPWLFSQITCLHCLSSLFSLLCKILSRS